MTSGIYLITNKINGKKYIGQSLNIEQRWRTYRAHRARKTSCRLISKAIQKYGIENFDFSIIEIVDQDNLFITTILNEREKFWIKELNTIVDHKKGYNLTYGGDSHGVWSLDSRKRMSETHKKIIHTPE
jgi:group I intron endonuclease